MLIRNAAAVVLVASMFTGCDDGPRDPPPPPPPDAECELDLNVDVASAADTGAALGTPGTGSGVLCPAFDQDFFAFEIPTAGTIGIFTITMNTAITAVNPAYRILRDNGTAEGAPTPFSANDAGKSAGEATNFTGLHRFEEPGRYYVAVSDVTAVEQAFDILNEYTLTVELASDPDANEANDTPATATALTSAVAMSGQVATSGDQDWYRLPVGAGAKIVDVTLQAAADTAIEHELLIFAADGLTQVGGGVATATGPVAGSQSLRLRFAVVGGADTLLLVKDRSGQKASLAATDSYSFTATVVDNPDANEGAAGNDTIATATVVTSGAELTASLASLADQDIYRITPPANASRATPSVLIIGIDIDGVDVRTFRPQVQVVAVDPEANAQQQQCRANCAFCDQNACKSARLQRFVRGGGGYQTAVALRDARDVLVIVNEFGDDAFQEAATYTVRFEVVADPDPGEGDDVLIPNLEFAGFENEADLARQFNGSKARARVVPTTFLPLCDDDDGAEGEGEGEGEPPPCLPLVSVPTPIAGVPEPFTRTVDCTGVAPQTVSLSGRLTYEGDRDYFRVDLPDEGYWGLDFNYRMQGASTTPVELTLFVRANNTLIANTLTAAQTQSNCLDTIDCPGGSICVDGACWADGDNNPTFASRIFPQGNECAFVSVVNRGARPLFIEVTDNGINDFDVDVSYTFDLTLRCGCPASCNGGGGFCQGVAAPN